VPFLSRSAFAAITGGLVAAIGCGNDPGGSAIDAAVDGAATLDAATDATITSDHFSFFVTSLRSLQHFSGNPLGFGGDLRFGETGPGAGLRGADKLCATIAEASLPGAGAKTWRAFLSAVDDGAGHQVNAIDRIGGGPWYDRIGRLFAPDLASLLSTRPQGGDPTIQDDFPNEDGVRNHDPDLTGDVDNHDMLTGSDPDGHLESANRTCLDWTANAGNQPLEGEPRVGHSWPAMPPDLIIADINGWMSSLIESGCAPGVNLIEMGGPNPSSNTVGSGGGYGGFYCFALTP
jgi:hypothetical protein